MSGGGSWDDFHLHLTDPETPGTAGSGTRRGNDDVYYPHMSGVPDEDTHDDEGTPTGGSRSEPRIAYSPAETQKVFAAFIATSEDPIVGNNQRAKAFWERVASLYNTIRPTNTPPRTYRMLQAHFYRASADIGKFNGIFINEEKKAGSGASGRDIFERSLAIFHEDTNKHFKYTSTWKEVRHLDKWAGGLESTTDSGSGGRRSKRPSTDSEHTSEGRSVPEQRQRPMGVKAAKAARGKGKGRAGPSQADTQPLPADKTTLYGYLMKMSMVDVSGYTPQQLELHYSLINKMRAELDMPPQDPPPPQ